MTTPPHHRFREHSLSATPQDRRKFTILCILAGIIVFLIWIFVFPLSYYIDPNTKNLGPRGVIHAIDTVIKNGFHAYRNVRETQNSIP